MTIEINTSKKIPAATMSDCGTVYYAPFEYRLDGDVEIYGEDYWRTGRIVWDTTEAWKAESEAAAEFHREHPAAGYYGYQCQEVNLEDESMACDWDEYEIQDDGGNLLPESAAAQVAKML